jgi:hypothetical protein
MAKRPKPGAQWREMGRRQKMLNAKKSSKPVIPDRILRKLASLNLPPNEWVYSVCLRELMREVR